MLWIVIRRSLASILVFTLLSFSGCSPSFRQTGPVKSVTEEFWLWTIDFSPNTDKFVAGGTNGYLAIGTKNGYEDHLPVDGQVTEVEWHPTSSAFAVAIQGGQKSFIRHHRDGVAYELDGINDFGARALGWSPDGTQLAIGDYSGNLTIHNIRGELITVIKVNDKGIIGLDWSPDGNTIAMVGDDIVLVDLPSKTTTTIQDRTEEVLILSVAFHPSGAYFVTGDYGNAETNVPPLLQYWTPDGQPIKKIAEGRGEYRSIEWSHDGKLLATASDRVRVFDPDGTLINRGEETSTFLWGISWSRNDSLIAATDS